MSRKKAWKLDPDEVWQGGSARATSAVRGGTKCGDTWAKQVRTYEVVLTHEPTGREGRGEDRPRAVVEGEVGRRTRQAE